MDIEITPVEHHQVTINGHIIGVFEVVSEWEGFKKLRSKRGEIVIYDETNWTDRIFSDFFKNQSKQKIKVILMTPDLMPSETE